MSDVSREEFDRLAGRVDRNERTLDATVSLIAAEVVGLRTAMDEQFHTVITMIGNEATHLDHRFDAVEARLGGIDQRIDGVDTRFDGVDTRFDGIDTRFDGIDTRFDGVDTRLESLDTKLDRIIDALGGD